MWHRNCALEQGFLPLIEHIVFQVCWWWGEGRRGLSLGREELLDIRRSKGRQKGRWGRRELLDAAVPPLFWESGFVPCPSEGKLVNRETPDCVGCHHFPSRTRRDYKTPFLGREMAEWCLRSRVWASLKELHAHSIAVGCENESSGVPLVAQW